MKKLFVLLQRKKANKQQGYILFQVVMVLAIIVALCAVALPSLSFLNQRLVKLEAEKLVLMCRYVQRVALATAHDQEIRLDLARGIYEGAGHREVLPSGVRFGVIPGSSGPPANPKTLLVGATTYQGNVITCYANGVVQAGAVYFVDNKYHVMYAVSTAVAPFAQLALYRYNAQSRTWTAL